MASLTSNPSLLFQQFLYIEVLLAACLEAIATVLMKHKTFSVPE
jgi:hypothetical protein